MKKTLLLSMMMAMTMAASAQNAVVNVETAGTLKSQPIGLTLTGSLNKADLNYLDSAVFTAIDMKEATIENNAIPDSAFLTHNHLNDKGAIVWDGNKTIKSIVLPAGIESIGQAAFNNAAIENADFSACKSLKTIGENAFELTDLCTIDFTGLSALTIIDKNSMKQTHASSIILDGCTSLETIEEYALSQNYYATALSFAGCSSLKHINNRAFLNFGKYNGDGKNGVEAVDVEVDLTPCTQLDSIGESAFQSARIMSIKLPKSLKAIGAAAFNLSKVTKIEFEGTVPPALYKNSFTAKMMEEAEVIVPAGSEEAYKAAGFVNVNTGISSARINKISTSDAPVYDMKGMMVEMPANGIFIQNGKKVAVK